MSVGESDLGEAEFEWQFHIPASSSTGDVVHLVSHFIFLAKEFPQIVQQKTHIKVFSLYNFSKSLGTTFGTLFKSCEVFYFFSPAVLWCKVKRNEFGTIPQLVYQQAQNCCIVHLFWTLNIWRCIHVACNLLHVYSLSSEVKHLISNFLTLPNWWILFLMFIIWTNSILIVYSECLSTSCWSSLLKL